MTHHPLSVIGKKNLARKLDLFRGSDMRVRIFYESST